MTYRITGAEWRARGMAPGDILAGLGQADLSEWWVRAAFWSKWAGPPPCPSGAEMTPSDCQYTGVFAEQVPPGEHEQHAERLDLWLEKRCAGGYYVSLSVPYFDPGLGKTVIAVFAGPGVPDKFEARPRHAPTLTTYDCQGTPSGCPEGMVELPGGGCQMPAPPGGDIPGKVAEKTFDALGDIARGWALGALAGGALAVAGLHAYSRRAR